VVIITNFKRMLAVVTRVKTRGGLQSHKDIKNQNSLKLEIKYAWGYSINYHRYINDDKSIYVIVGENVSWRKLSILSKESGIKYILYRTDLGEIFSNFGGE